MILLRSFNDADLPLLKQYYAPRLSADEIKRKYRKRGFASPALHRALGFETDGYAYINKKGNEVAIYLRSLI